MNTHNDFGQAVDQTDIRFLVDKSADGVVVLDENGVVLFANPAAEHIFGRAAAVLTGSLLGVPLLVGDSTEISVHQPSGAQVDTEVRCVATVWNHRPARLASLRDVSARKVEEERQRHAAQMEAVGRLTAGIAHDFNNLLTVVLGNLDSARRQLASPGAVPLRAVENALHGARRAAVLTERLLAFARRKPLAPCVLDVNALVGGMSDLLRRTLGEKINVRTRLGRDLRNVETDPTELETTILNLVVNARDAMPHGGDLVIETTNFEADARLASASGMEAGYYVLIAVTDSGTGMAPDMLKLVFEPFFTTKINQGGTGLGLSQVYGFVKQSGGHVHLYSEPGLGTTAKIYLRAADTQLATQLELSEATNRPLPRGTASDVILVVEDDDDVRRYTAESLIELGYTVLQASNAASALPFIERESPLSLLFTDLGLPGDLDGKALAQRARQLRPTLPVLITSAYAGALLRDDRLDAEVELLSKPFTLATLSQRVQQLLAQRVTGGDRPQVLVVDDELLVRMFVADMLTEAGYQVEEAGTAQEALIAVRAPGARLAAALIDLGLPDRSGADLAVEIRAVLPELPIVLTTGHDVQNLRQRFAGDLQVRILPKPFARAALLELFQAVV